MVKAISLTLIAVCALYFAGVTPDRIKRSLDSASKEHATVSAFDENSEWN